MSLTIAYLINQYPKVSHSFIRREITSVEAYGIRVRRFSIRSCSTELVDEADKLEIQKTRVVLGNGMLALLFSLLRVAVTRPIRWHDASVEASKLAALFRSSIEPLQDQVIIGCTAKGCALC